MNFSDGIKSLTNLKQTENGGIAYSTSGSSLLDLFAWGGSLRTRSEEEIRNMYLTARDEDKELADSFVLYVRDIRNTGCGERRTGRILLKTLAALDPNKIIRNFQTIVNAGRYDDLFIFIGTPVEKEMFLFIKEQLTKDIINYEKKEPISLLAKWLKSSNTSSKESKNIAKKTYSFLGINEKDYRKLLSILREYLNITERYMSLNQWEKIDFSKVPAYSMSKYRNAFRNKQPERFQKYIDELKSGETKINSSVLFPHDLIKRYDITHIDDIIEEQWKNLPDYVNGEKDVLVMTDISGSMVCGGAIYVSIGLGIYFAQRNKGAYHNQFMTFSKNPRLVSLDDCYTLRDSITKTSNPSYVGFNTDLNKAFKLIYDIAKDTNDAPAALVVISDMEIDSYKEDSFGIINKWRKKFDEIDVELPKLILWNAQSRNDTQLSDKNDPNVSFISGCSAATFSHLDTLISKSSYSAMVEILSSPQFQWQ